MLHLRPGATPVLRGLRAILLIFLMDGPLVAAMVLFGIQP